MDEEMEEVKEEVKAYDKDYVELLEKENERLESEAKDYQETHKAEVEKLALNHAIDMCILKNGGKNITAIKSLLNLDGVSIENGVVGGVNEQLEQLKNMSDSEFLFEGQKNVKFTGVKPYDGVGKDMDISKMTYSEIVQYLEHNPSATL